MAQKYKILAGILIFMLILLLGLCGGIIWKLTRPKPVSYMERERLALEGMLPGNRIRTVAFGVILPKGEYKATII